MSTNGVAKLYDRLDAQERTSALLAAWTRDDERDAHRLNATAPRRWEARWHHHDRVRAIWTLTAMVRIEIVETLADLWHAQALLAWTADTDGPDDDPVSEDVAREFRLWKSFADVCCFKLSRQREAWLIVTDKLNIAAEFLDTFGDCVALKLTFDRLADNTPTADVVREQLSEFSETVGDVATAEGIAAGWLDVFTGLSGAATP